MRWIFVIVLSASGCVTQRYRSACQELSKNSAELVERLNKHMFCVQSCFHETEDDPLIP